MGTVIFHARPPRGKVSQGIGALVRQALLTEDQAVPYCL